ncbi:MAG: hypothetical protein NZ921_05280 [Candidatus Caldarchaeum sp.]|nr:hypothetical protein [Candidatus Caldarchaeum sp.]
MPIVKPGKTIEFTVQGKRGWLIIDTLIMGKSWGGVRINPYSSMAEAMILARTLTLKTALAGIPIGGAKTCIAADPGSVDKDKLIEKLAEILGPIVLSGLYIPGTDMGFAEEDLQNFYRMIGMKPRYGLHKPSGKLSWTGLAVAESLHTSIIEVVKKGDHDCYETVALEGIGNMGSAAAHILSRKGFRVIAVSNRFHTLINYEGIDVDHLLELKHAWGEECLRRYSVTTPGSKLASPHELFNVEADIIVPGAGVLEIDKPLKCKIIAPIANYPISLSKIILFEKTGIKVVPDIISTAGGAIGSALSLFTDDFNLIKATIIELTRRNLKKIITAAERNSTTWTEQAYKIAEQRIKTLKKLGPIWLPSYVSPIVRAAQRSGLPFIKRLKRTLTKVIEPNPLMQ